MLELGNIQKITYRIAKILIKHLLKMLMLLETYDETYKILIK